MRMYCTLYDNAVQRHLFVLNQEKCRGQKMVDLKKKMANQNEIVTMFVLCFLLISASLN